MSTEDYKKRLESILISNHASSFSELMRSYLIYNIFFLLLGFSFLLNFFSNRHQIKGKIENVAQSTNSGFHVASFIERQTKKEFFAQPKGLVCQNKACGLETNILLGGEKICKKCYKTEYSTNSLSGHMAFFCRVRSLTLNPVLLVELISRHSRGLSISKDLFVCLREMVFNNRT
jgi:hypothetical protein